MGTSRFEVQGHRGARALRPENTLDGFRFALSLGVSAIELDVTLSADDAVIVTHEPVADGALYRDTGPVHPYDPYFPYVGKRWSELDLPRIATLDAGGRRRAGAGAEPFAGTRRPLPSSRVPTLDDVFRLANRLGDRRVGFEIEAKVGPAGERRGPDAVLLARRITDVIRRHRMTGRCRLRSFDWRVLAASRRLAPRLPVVALAGTYAGEGWRSVGGSPTRRGPWHAALAGGARELGAVAVAPVHDAVDVALIRMTRRFGLAVLPWTVNDPQRMGELIDMGVDGLCTDRPDRLRAVLSARGMAVPGTLVA